MKPLKIILLLSVLLLTIPQIAFSTAQIPDKIIYEGKEYILHTNPLEIFFEKYPEQRPELEWESSALWRGYVATFEIIDSELFVKDVEVMNYESGSTETEWISVFKDIFPDSEKLKADWFTGLMILPFGKMENYVHMGFASEYSNYLLLEIEDGRLNKDKKFTQKQYKKFKERQFEAFKETTEYVTLKKELNEKDSGMSDEFIDNILRDFVTSYSSKILVE